MRIVGFSSGTGYLCQRDTLGRMRGLLGEQRGLGEWKVEDMIPGADAVGSILGTLIGGGAGILAAQKQAEAARQQANFAAAKALRDAGSLAQQQAFAASQKKVEMQALTKTVVISAVAIGGLALAGLIVYRMTEK